MGVDIAEFPAPYLLNLHMSSKIGFHDRSKKALVRSDGRNTFLKMVRNSHSDRHHQFYVLCLLCGLCLFLAINDIDTQFSSTDIQIRGYQSSFHLFMICGFQVVEAWGNIE